ncbi:hypothetical protein BCV72DRAFT_12545 [Rhizopus microsporus var. microsporus]|uniref:Uncharacterized protein n=1 Tax=Rhizopus microsporus var. microsporus TaxID=86635 RepID=A0A1X0QXX2_RHIZD|nr:hypothetical protein BCV72DRAFT_12545 [Rhizopus microsporus var. microsporus]
MNDRYINNNNKRERINMPIQKPEPNERYLSSDQKYYLLSVVSVVSVLSTLFIDFAVSVFGVIPFFPNETI